MLNKSKKIISYYYIVISAVVIFQTVCTCVSLAQNTSFHHKLNHLDSQKSLLEKELETKQFQLSQASSLLANLDLIDQSFSPIISPIAVSSLETVALR